MQMVRTCRQEAFLLIEAFQVASLNHDILPLPLLQAFQAASEVQSIRNVMSSSHPPRVSLASMPDPSLFPRTSTVPALIVFSSREWILGARTLWCSAHVAPSSKIPALASEGSTEPPLLCFNIAHRVMNDHNAVETAERRCWYH